VAPSIRSSNDADGHPRLRRTTYAPVVPAPSPSDALAAESEHGVSFEHYVGVTTALAEGFPLEAILAGEGIAADVWPTAEAMWTVRAAKDGADGELLSELRTKRAVAEDCLVRGVAPIDSDLGAWLRFLHVYRNHAAPFDMLEGAGLGLNDLARLQRVWARRMAADQALQKQAAELVKKGLGPPPLLRVEPKQLRPFPWTRRRTPDATP
jgi:hypothetical protein